MIYVWLILLALVYVVVAIVVGKVCAINSRWEKSVSRADGEPAKSAQAPSREAEAASHSVRSFAPQAEAGDVRLGAAGPVDAD
jgi:hypothetical protein